MLTRRSGFKIMALIMVVILAVALGPYTTSAQVVFDDVDPSSDHYDSIMELAEGNVFLGNDGKFNPYEPITRGQVAAVLSRALLLDPPNDAGAVTYFYDDVSHDNEHLGQIAAVIYFEIFTGKNGKFHPYKPINREQMATVIVNAFDLEGLRTKNYQEVPLTDKKISNTHRKNVQILANHGITNQTDDFRAFDSVKRDQFASFLTRAFYAVQQYRH